MASAGEELEGDKSQASPGREEEAEVLANPHPKLTAPG